MRIWTCSVPAGRREGDAWASRAGRNGRRFQILSKERNGVRSMARPRLEALQRCTMDGHELVVGEEMKVV